MAVKIMETKTGEVTMTSEQVKRDRTVRKVQKYLSVAQGAEVSQCSGYCNDGADAVGNYGICHWCHSGNQFHTGRR